MRTRPDMHPSRFLPPETSLLILGVVQNRINTEVLRSFKKRTYVCFAWPYPISTQRSYLQYCSIWPNNPISLCSFTVTSCLDPHRDKRLRRFRRALSRRVNLYQGAFLRYARSGCLVLLCLIFFPRVKIILSFIVRHFVAIVTYGKANIYLIWQPPVFRALFGTFRKRSHKQCVTYNALQTGWPWVMLLGIAIVLRQH